MKVLKVSLLLEQTKEILRLLALSIETCTQEEVESVIFKLGKDECGKNMTRQGLQEIWSVITSETTTTEATTVSCEDLKKLKVKELKELLNEKGLCTKGVKSVLMERLSSSTTKKEETISRSVTILILSEQLQRFPWESLPILQQEAVSRLPSLTSFWRRMKLRTADRTITNKYNSIRDGVRINQVEYILNPQGDLKTTEQALEVLFKENGWKGQSGIATDTKEHLSSLLVEKDVYIYCGHGAGEQYLHRDHIAQLSSCPVTFLIGCSSGKLEQEGTFEPTGMALAYLSAGSPAVVSMLWDVTDKDIDRFSIEVLSTWFSSNGTLNLLEILPRARATCKLPFLNGMAAICYGIPMYTSAVDR